jgi:hypothetical protein
MGLDAILPLIREVGSLRERGEYGAAAELEERIRQPLTVAGRVLEPDDIAWQWWRPSSDEDNASLMVSAVAGEWTAVLTMYGDGPWITQTGRGPTIAAALADAQARYQAAIADTLLRMGGLLREVACAPARYPVGDPLVERVRHPEPVRACEVCGRPAQAMGTEARCSAHDSEKGCAA